MCASSGMYETKERSGVKVKDFGGGKCKIYISYLNDVEVEVEK